MRQPDGLELVSLPAEAGDLGPLAADARERPTEAHRHHQEHALPQVRQPKDVRQRARRAGRVPAEGSLMLEGRERAVQHVVKGTLGPAI